MANHRKLGRPSDQRMAMLRNQVTNLIWYGKIETTLARGKEVQSMAEHLITIAMRQCDNTVELTKKTKKVAMRSALSSKVAAGEMIVLDAITANEYKTKAMVSMLDAVGAAKKALIVLPEVNAFVIKSCDNIEGVKTTQWNTINVYDILNCDTLIVAKDAVAKIEEVYAR